MGNANGQRQWATPQIQCQKDVVVDNILVTNNVKTPRAHMLLIDLPI
jgi:hypothetical protein